MGEAPQYHHGASDGGEAGSDSEIEERSVHDSEEDVESAEESVDGGYQLPPLMPPEAILITPCRYTPKL